MSILIRGAARQGSPASVLAYVTGNDGAAIAQAGIASIQRTVYDLSSATPAAAVAVDALTVADVVLDTPGAWDIDEAGYNFADAVEAAIFAAADRVYRIVYLFTPVAGEPWVVPAIVPAED